MGGPVPPEPPRTRPGAAPRGSLTGRAAVLLLVLAVLAVSYAYPLRTWFEQRARIADLTATSARLTTEISDMQTQQKRWDDPAYVAAQARARLTFVKPGEVGFTVVDPGSSAGSARPHVEPAPSDGAPWWSRMWSTVEAADRADTAGSP